MMLLRKTQIIVFNGYLKLVGLSWYTNMTSSSKSISSDVISSSIVLFMVLLSIYSRSKWLSFSNNCFELSDPTSKLQNKN